MEEEGRRVAVAIQRCQRGAGRNGGTLPSHAYSLHRDFRLSLPNGLRLWNLPPALEDLMGGWQRQTLLFQPGMIRRWLEAFRSPPKWMEEVLSASFTTSRCVVLLSLGFGRLRWIASSDEGGGVHLEAAGGHFFLDEGAGFGFVENPLKTAFQIDHRDWL
jgi:hypothetical protein